MKYTVTECTTRNNSQGLIVNVADAPVVTMKFDFRAGYNYVQDYDNKTQLAHVAEHVVYVSSQKYPDPMQLEAVFNKNGAFRNAWTSYRSMGYMAVCADFEWERILDLVRTQICQPNFDQRIFTTEVGNIRSELAAALSNPGQMLGPAMTQAFGLNNKTYQQFIDSLDNIKLQDLINHYNSTHLAENMRFIISGDFSGDRLIKLKQMLDDFTLPTGGKRLDIIGNGKVHPAKPVLIKRKDVPAISFSLSMYIPRRMTDEECQTMAVLNHILTGTLGSRIFGQARQKGLLYHCSAGASAGMFESEWGIDGRANDDKLDELFDLIINELKLVRDGKIDEQDIADAKSYAMGNFKMGIQTAEQMANYLAGRYFYDGKIKRYEDKPAEIEAVTKEKVIKLADEYLTTAIWGIGLYGTTTADRLNTLNTKLKQLFEK